MPTHSYYLGSSIFEFRWLPGFLTANRRIARFFDPLAAIALGLLAWTISPSLGVVLIFSGYCLRVFESAVWRLEQERMLDATDAIIEAEFQARIITGVFDNKSSPRGKNNVATGIPTGMSPDLDRKLNPKAKNSRKEDYAHTH